MPHSSGGGSHGGGSHGGSHSHGGGGGGSSQRYSGRYFPGARRYMYHRRNGSVGYIYTDRPIRKSSVIELIIPLVILIPFMFVPIIALFSSGINFGPPKPLKTLSTYEQTHIADNIDVINERELEPILAEFQTKTGICPYVMTVNNEDWQGRYSSLENYAYDLYVNTFGDEQHWLVIYSEPETPDEDFNDWYWEGMQGNDTDRILTESKANKFLDSLHKYLTKNDVSVTEAFCIAFSEANGYMMERNTSLTDLLPFAFFILIWVIVIGANMVGMIVAFVRGRRDYTEVPKDYVYTGDNDPFNPSPSEQYTTYSSSYVDTSKDDYDDPTIIK